MLWILELNGDSHQVLIVWRPWRGGTILRKTYPVADHKYGWSIMEITV